MIVFILISNFIYWFHEWDYWLKRTVHYAPVCCGAVTIAALCEGACILCFSLLIIYVFCYEVALSRRPCGSLLPGVIWWEHIGALPAAGGDRSHLLGEPQRELGATVKILVLLILMTSNFAFSLSLAQLQGWIKEMWSQRVFPSCWRRALPCLGAGLVT